MTSVAAAGSSPGNVEDKLSARLSYRAHFNRLVRSVLDVLKQTEGPLPRAHGWPEDGGPGPFRGRRPSDIVKSIETLVDLMDHRHLDDEARCALVSSFLHEVWMGEESREIFANTVAIVESMFEHKDDATMYEFTLHKFQDAQVARPERLAKKVTNLFDAVVFLLGREMDATFDHELTTDLICRVHEKVGARGLIRGAGRFRIVAVCAQGCGLVYLSPGKIATRLQALVQATNTALAEHSPDIAGCIAVGAVFFSEFLLIHPFLNGNGRVARLMLNYLLRRIVIVPFTLGGHYGGYCAKDRSAAAAQYARERRLYIELLKLRNDKQTPPSMLATYVLASCERTASDALYLTTS